MIPDRLKRARIKFSDAIRHAPIVREAYALLLLLYSCVSGDATTRRFRATAAYQKAETEPLLKLLAEMLARGSRVQSIEKSELPAPRLRHYRRHTQRSSQVNRSLILKAPGPSGERGVLLVQFEYNWFRILDGIDDLSRLTDEYDILWGTSWSPTDYALVDRIMRSSRDAIYVLPSHPSEAAKLQRFDNRLHCPPVLSACDWVNPSFFTPKAHADRSIDILMVANWAPFKRHFELFSALSRMPPELKITLIGQPEGEYTSDHIRSLLRLYRVPQDVTILESLRIEQVTQHQCDAKVALVLSKREGSCVAAVEALFSGAALGMHKGAHIGALKYVNKDTGAHLSGHSMANDLVELLEKTPSLDPRKWAENNISCHLNLYRLDEFLQEQALARGLPWSEGLTPFHWRPYPAYVHNPTDEKLGKAYEKLHARFPKVFSNSLSNESYL